MAVFELYLLVCWSVVAAVMWGLFPGAMLGVGALAAFTTVPLLVFFSRRRWTFYPSAAFRVWVVRPVLYAQLLLPLVVIASVLGALGGAPFGVAYVAARIAALIILVTGAVLLVAGYVGSRSLVVREVVATIPGLPPAFDGLRIVQLSDLHVGPHIPPRFLARVSRAVQQLQPDLVAVTGDLIDDRAEDVEAYARGLGGIAAPLGVFMIPGNHDVYAGWDAVEHELGRQVKGRILVNETYLLRRGAAVMAVVGTGDPAGTYRGANAATSGRVAPDLARAFADVPPDTVVLALAHNPALWPALAKRGVALTLSGHTHWGQFALPRRGWSLASRFLPHAMGSYREGNSLLYITPGTGYWGIPFRLGALPEVTLVTLHHGETAAIEMGATRAAE